MDGVGATGLESADNDMAPSSSLPPRGNLLPEPSNSFHVHAANARKAAKTKATAAASLEKRRAAAAQRAEKSEKAARDRAAAGLPPLRRRPSRKAASPRPVTCAVGGTTGDSTVLPSAAPAPLNAPAQVVTLPLVATPTSTPVLASPAAPPMGSPLALCAADVESPMTHTPSRASATAPLPAAVATFPLPLATLTPAVAPAPPAASMATFLPANATTVPNELTARARAPLPRATQTTVTAMTTRPVPPAVGVPVLAMAPAASLSPAGPSTPVAQTPTFAVAPAASAVAAGRAGWRPPTAAAWGPRGGATSARPPVQAASLPSAAPGAARVVTTTVGADASAVASPSISEGCLCSDGREVKLLHLRIDELEAAAKKRRAAINLQLKDLSKRQTVASAHTGDVKRILSEVLKAVNCVGTALGHGASATRELCRTVEQRGAAGARTAGAANGVDSSAASLHSPSFFDVPRKAPWAKDTVVSRELPDASLFV